MPFGETLFIVAVAIKCYWEFREIQRLVNMGECP